MISPDVDAYWESLAGALPPYTSAERAVARTLYRELAKGSPLSTARIAETLGETVSGTRRLLSSETIDCMTYRDDEGRVIGFGGLAMVPMKHRLRTGGRDLWTWCAWDGLFIPRILGARAELSSLDPQTEEEVRVVVTPEGVTDALPTNAVVSFVAPDPSEFATSASRVMTSFCYYVYLFASEESGREWAASHEGTFLYTLPEGFELGRRLAGHVLGTGGDEALAAPAGGNR